MVGITRSKVFFLVLRNRNRTLLRLMLHVLSMWRWLLCIPSDFGFGRTRPSFWAICFSDFSLGMHAVPPSPWSSASAASRWCRRSTWLRTQRLISGFNPKWLIGLKIQLLSPINPKKTSLGDLQGSHDGWILDPCTGQFCLGLWLFTEKAWLVQIPTSVALMGTVTCDICAGPSETYLIYRS